MININNTNCQKKLLYHKERNELLLIATANRKKYTVFILETKIIAYFCIQTQ